MSFDMEDAFHNASWLLSERNPYPLSPDEDMLARQVLTLLELCGYRRAEAA